MPTILIKTAKGQQAFKERHPQLSGKQRSAFLLFDGHRTLAEVLTATQGLGITAQDIEHFVDEGFLEPLPTAPDLAPAAMADIRTPSERYRDAYPVAVALTGKLGLAGFRLNLSVEGATSYEELAAVAPKIKEAVGAQAFHPLEQALFGQ